MAVVRRGVARGAVVSSILVDRTNAVTEASHVADAAPQPGRGPIPLTGVVVGSGLAWWRAVGVVTATRRVGSASRRLVPTVTGGRQRGGGHGRVQGDRERVRAGLSGDPGDQFLGHHLTSRPRITRGTRRMGGAW